MDGVALWIEWAKGPPPQVPIPEVAQDDSSNTYQKIESIGCSEKDGCRYVNIIAPVDIRKKQIIDQMAKYVAQEGHQFEMVIMEKEPQDGNHEDFSFLFQHDSPENRYYRWRVFSFAQGDNYRTW